MFEKLNDIWNDYGFEILIGLSVTVIVVFAIFRYGKRGTYSRSYYYVPTPTMVRKRRPPTTSTGEKVCRSVLENIFKRKFPKVRPAFLSNPVTGGSHNLEIDCYNEELKLGVEYSGRQHYEYTPFFHRSKDAFLNQKYRDQMKKEMCKKNGVCLIIVPYTIPSHQIQNYLISELKQHRYLN